MSWAAEGVLQGWLVRSMQTRRAASQGCQVRLSVRLVNWNCECVCVVCHALLLCAQVCWPLLRTLSTASPYSRTMLPCSGCEARVLRRANRTLAVAAPHPEQLTAGKRTHGSSAFKAALSSQHQTVTRLSTRGGAAAQCTAAWRRLVRGW